MLVIDGSYCEGGGQVLRTSLSLSIVLKKPFRMIKIRANRPKPGLQPQHYACVEACKKISGAYVEGASLHSQELTFIPREAPPAKEYVFDIGTAGSTSLLFQTLFYPLALAGGGKLILIGGTHVPFSPTFHYLERVFLPVVKILGFSAETYLERAGFYPKGGGKAIFRIFPRRDIPLPETFQEFKPEKVTIVSLISEDLPEHILLRQAKSALEILENLPLEKKIDYIKVRSQSPGTMLLVYSESGSLRAGKDFLGKKGVPAEEIGRRGGEALLDFLRSRAQFDEFLGDQILLPLSFAMLMDSVRRFSYTVSRVTGHLLTQAWLIPQFIENLRINIQGNLGERGVVTLERS